MGAPLSGATFAIASLDAVRDAMAARLLPDHDVAERVGAISLWPHQRDAVARVRRALAELGGALLADDVGLGKTFVALAVAGRYAAPLVVAPAALRDVWRGAMARAGVPCGWITFESLGRGGRPAARPDLVIVDEAHHARNPATKRYAALSALVAGADVLLLTATPLHNSRRDLLALLGLFAGARAAAFEDAALARCIVRRSRDVAAAALPRVDGPHSLHPCADHASAGDGAIPEAILALPPALPAADGGTAHALLLVTMIRQWSSSSLALRRGVERRLAVARALESSLDAGRHPTKREIAAWTLGPDAQQLAFPELLAPATAPAEPSFPALREAVRLHSAGLHALATLAREHAGDDARRAALLLDAWRATPGARLLAFTQFADTVGAYWQRLRTVPGVCTLTARGGRIASGAISRAEAVGSLGPNTRSSPTARIDALLATDLASEGLDLQGASTLVHLDLPWTPARLEQRVGRVVRPGAASDVVRVYVMEPPARADVLVSVRERLAAKLAAARLAFGPVMPGLLASRDAGGGEAAPPVLDATMTRVLRRWQRRSAGHRISLDDGPPWVAAVRSTAEEGWLALYDAEPPLLAARLGARRGAGLALVVRVLTLADGAPLDAGGELVARAVADADAWRDAHWGASLAGIPELGAWRERRGALTRAAALASTPRSRRPVAVEGAKSVRALALAPLGGDAERRLALAARTVQDLGAWAEQSPELAGACGARPVPGRPPALRALIVLAAP